MSDEKTDQTSRNSSFKNWLSLAGAVLAAGSLFSFLLLLMLDSFAHFSNPYIGILTYLVAPGFLVMGIFLILVGWWRARRRETKFGPLLSLKIDLSRPRDRRRLGWFIVGSVVFLLISAVGSYQTYHFTESVQFCGQACHTVMQPELVTYSHGPHARVACVECHIGPGAAWFVKAKVSGLYQVYAVAFNKYPTPIPTPIKNLRPAQETCEQCHWPKKFVGNLDRTYNYFLGDETNTPFSVRLTMKVGGGDPTHGPVGGIHWHMNVANKVEYIASDEARQVIPWVRITDQQGHVTVYEAKNGKLKPEQVTSEAARRMDCIDCHNRPTHIFHAPDESVDISLSLGRIDPSLPSIKKNAVDALTVDYQTESEAQQKIADTLSQKYASSDPATVQRAIVELQKIYRENFFPQMKSSWKVYPNNIGHYQWAGCFRCHDGEHVGPEGKTISADCNSCHTIIAQGPGTDMKTLSAQGFEFQHPSEDLGDAWKGQKCSECHNGASM